MDGVQTRLQIRGANKGSPNILQAMVGPTKDSLDAVAR
jgi:hypothetical protein